MIERFPIEAPQLTLFIRCDRRGSRVVIQQRELTKSLTRLISPYKGGLRIAFVQLGALQRAATHHVQAVSFIAFADDLFLGLRDDFFHRVHDYQLFVLFETREHE